MIQIVNKKKFAMTIAIGVLLVAGIVFGILAWKKHKDNKNPENQPQVYEALVNIVDQKAGDSAEDARSSLKKGDVIAYFPEGHPWSETESISYLIVKIKLKPDEAAKLTEAETKEIKKEKTKEKGPDGKEIEDMGPQMETVRARKYQLNLPSFDLQKFWENHEQPFKDKVFSGSIINKK
jgi:hypothetical protein